MVANARLSVDGTAGALHAVAIRLLRRVRRSDVGMGLSPARASALSVLVFGGSRTIGELAAVEQVAPPTMTRLVAGLEADGHVRRSRDAGDGRVTRVRATAKGRRVLEAGRRRRVAQVAQLLGGLSPAELARVDAVVAMLERRLDGQGGERGPVGAGASRQLE